jgi:hypothetical protein
LQWKQQEKTPLNYEIHTVKHLCISYMPGENHSLDRRNKTHRNVIDVMVRNITPMNADLKRPYVISATKLDTLRRHAN